MASNARRLRLAKFEKELGELFQTEPAKFNCSVSEIVVIISSIQIALHEGNMGKGMRKLMRTVAQNLILTIGLTPTVRSVLLAGFGDVANVICVDEVDLEAN